MPTAALAETVRRLAAQGEQRPTALVESRFDLTAGETHEGFVFRCQKRTVETIEHFIAEVVQQVFGHVGVKPPEHERQLEQLSISELSGPLLDTTAWLQATPAVTSSASKSEPFTSLLSELQDAQCLYYVHEVGPPPVQELVIAETANEYVAVYWYTSG